MSWGVYQKTKDGNVHVMPCNEDGTIARGHILEASGCWCEPLLEDGVAIHN